MDNGMNERDRSEAATRRIAVWALLKDGAWHTTMEINDVTVGGSEGCRRLRELRAECRTGKRAGWADILCRRSLGDSTQWEYRVVPVELPKPKSVPEPETRPKGRAWGWAERGSFR
jgi:hypothetical protein